MNGNKKIRPQCPNCGSRNIARIQWGRPAWSENLEKELKTGETVLGGCFISKDSMNWQCRECGHRFSRIGIEGIAWFHKKEKPDYIAAHAHSFANRKEITGSKICGCFYCLEIFEATDIYEWNNDTSPDTALCPYCCLDSVIGDKSGFSITKEFLKTMHDYWFDMKSN